MKSNERTKAFNDCQCQVEFLKLHKKVACIKANNLTETVFQFFQIYRTNKELSFGMFFKFEIT